MSEWFAVPLISLRVNKRKYKSFQKQAINVKFRFYLQFHVYM